MYKIFKVTKNNLYFADEQRRIGCLQPHMIIHEYIAYGAEPTFFDMTYKIPVYKTDLQTVRKTVDINPFTYSVDASQLTSKELSKAYVIKDEDGCYLNWNFESTKCDGTVMIFKNETVASEFAKHMIAKHDKEYTPKPYTLETAMALMTGGVLK